MAEVQAKKFLKHDDYMTPKSAWENIKEYIPKDKVIWECFYGDGDSGKYLTELGFNVIHKPVDFFKEDMGETLVSNPPFSKKQKIVTRLKELGKPFIMIMPSNSINTLYMRELFSNCKDKLQIIIPRRRINFTKKIDGKIPKGWGNRCNFDCFYYCWKMNLQQDIIWLNTEGVSKKI